jgi:nucleoside-diphosphate kinase
MIHETEERSLIIIKPDAVQRSLVGEIINRFERKGLKIIGMKMMHLKEALLKEHYAHVADKPFYPRIERFMMSSCRRP